MKIFLLFLVIGCLVNKVKSEEEKSEQVTLNSFLSETVSESYSIFSEKYSKSGISDGIKYSVEHLVNKLVHGFIKHVNPCAGLGPNCPHKKLHQKDQQSDKEIQKSSLKK